MPNGGEIRVIGRAAELRVKLGLAVPRVVFPIVESITSRQFPHHAPPLARTRGLST
ncbi:ABC transporter ATP binding protein [Corchorus olitorius]|uniref:ABC transporter ATP binding protein n=1 Tax=Corchorus olitorius TaxID=93759 RepID=A0A1R3K0X5_9ROSI|nr:ABC transporter ATP binding protein [Corchorus olitorius]